MSLDVYLTLENAKLRSPGSGIYIREEGQTKEISRAEWDEKFPGREPVVADLDRESDDMYSANITHNLGPMAREAGIYKHLWRPDEIDVTKAGQLIEPLRQGLNLLRNDPISYRKFNPENGWGSYEGFVDFVKEYLAACEEYPDADIFVSR